MSDYVPHFQEKEFACKCCGKGGIQEALSEKIEAARILAGMPFIINSGYRCTKNQNDLIARGISEPTSSHPKGLAVDIKAEHSQQRWLIIDALLRAGFRRIGIAKTFVHVDIDDSKDLNLIWLYGA